MQNDVRNSNRGPSGSSNKIGFFHLNHNTDEGSSSDDEYSGGGFHSDTSSDSTSSESDEGIVFPTGNDKRRPVSRGKKLSGSGLNELERRRRPGPLKRMRNSRSNPGLLTPMSSSNNLLGDRGSASSLSGSQTPGQGEMSETQARPPIWCRSRSPKPPASSIPSSLVDTGRTVEQGRDFLIELDGDLVNVFGIQALKFLDRPWNKQRSQKATSIQFNFVSFDDLVPYLGRLKQTFPNLVNFEFSETDIRSMNQLNALALLQGLTSLVIGKEGNPIT